MSHASLKYPHSLYKIVVRYVTRRYRVPKHLNHTRDWNMASKYSNVAKVFLSNDTSVRIADTSDKTTKIRFACPTTHWRETKDRRRSGRVLTSVARFHETRNTHSTSKFQRSFERNINCWRQDTCSRGSDAIIFSGTGSNASRRLCNVANAPEINYRATDATQAHYQHRDGILRESA